MTEKSFLKQHYEHSLKDREWLLSIYEQPNEFEQDILDTMKKIEDLILPMEEEEIMDFKSSLLSTYRRMFLRSYLERTK